LNPARVVSFDPAATCDRDGGREPKRDAAIYAEQIKGLLQSRDQVLDDARVLLARVSKLADDIRGVLELLARDQVVTGALFDAVRAGGAIRRHLSVDLEARWSLSFPTHQQGFEIVERLDGVAATQMYRIPASDLQALVVQPLEALREEELQCLSQMQLDGVARSIGVMLETLKRARYFEWVANEFLQPANLTKIAALRSAIPRSRLTAHSDRILKTFERLIPKRPRPKVFE
jgi:hypothetical protein